MANRKGNSEQDAVSLTKVIQSVLWAMLGVQTSSNHKRDFTKGKASHYIIIGIIMTTVFIGFLLGAVQLAVNL